MKKVILMLFIGFSTLFAQNNGAIKVRVLNRNDAAPHISVELTLGAGILNGFQLELPLGVHAVLESASLNKKALWIKRGSRSVSRQKNLEWAVVKNHLKIKFFTANPGDVIHLVLRPDGRHLKRLRNLSLNVFPLGNGPSVKNKKISTVQIPLNYIKTKK